MKLNSMSGWALRVSSLLVYPLLVQSCKPEDPDPEVGIQTGEIEEVGPTHSLIYGEILHEPYEEKNGFSVRCVLDRYMHQY